MRAIPDIDDSARRLVELGLAPNEARCYAALLHIGPATAREVADLSGVAQPKVYSTLKWLEQRSFCFASGERVTTYRAVDPQLALDEWTRAREHERRRATERDQRTRAELVSTLPAAPERAPEQAVNILELTGGRASTTEGLEQLIERSKRRVDIINAPPVIQPRPRWNTCEVAAMKRGVQVRMLFSTRELAIDHRYHEILLAGGDVRIARGAPPKLLLRDDGAEALVALANPADGHRPTCVRVRHADLVAPMQLLFNREWRQARALRAEHSSAMPSR